MGEHSKPSASAWSWWSRTYAPRHANASRGKLRRDEHQDHEGEPESREVK